MRLLFYALCFSLFLAPPLGAGGQDTITLRTEMLTVKDGLSQGLVIGIMQDKDGFLWFDSKDGLNKYDGYNFTVYRYEQDSAGPMKATSLEGLVEDDNGNFWVGIHDVGLCIFDRKTETFYPVKLNPTGSSTNAFPMQSKDGKLLLNNNGYYIYDVSTIHPNNYQSLDLTKATICFDANKMLPNKGYRQLFWMKDNTLWCSCADSFLVFSPSADKMYHLQKSFSNSILDAKYIEQYFVEPLPQKNRYLFTGNKQGVVYDFNTNKVIARMQFTDSHIFPRSAIMDKWGNYFIKGEPNSFYLNGKDYSLKKIKGEVGGMADHNGIQWKGTNGYGVIKYDYRKQLFEPVPRKAYRYNINDKGDMLCGAEYEMPYFMNVYTHKKQTVFPAGMIQKDWQLNEFVKDKEGNYWVLYYTYKTNSNYLLHYNTTNGKLQTNEMKTLTNRVQTKLMIDNNNDLWIASTNAQDKCVLAKINKTTLTPQTTYSFPAQITNLHPGYFVSAYWQDAHHVFWLATTDGLCSFDPEMDRRKNKWNYWGNKPGYKNSLNNNQLYSIAPDPAQPEKYLWLGTNGGGLNRFEIATGTFINYTYKDGLPNNVVYGLLSDKAGNLWMSTNRGLSCLRSPLQGRGAGGEANNAKLLTLNPSPKERDLNAFINFNTDDGLPGDEFNRYEYYKLANGDLFFGGMEGGVIFNPEKVLEKDAAPPIVFTGLSVFNNPVSYKTDSDIIQMPVTYAQTITLPHDKGMFSISYAALEFRAASKKHYKYFMEGYDKQWIDAGNKTEAIYTNLPPGTYTFHVTGAGSTGVWNNKGASIKVIILPAWWQTWWLRLLVAAVVAVAVYGFYRYRLRQALKLLSLRNRIARDLHDEIGSTLGSISLFGEVARKNLQSNPDKTDKLLEQINDYTNATMDSMSDIVWAINTRNDNFDNLINRMRAFASKVMEMREVNLSFKTAVTGSFTNLNMTQRKNVYLIFKEAVNNAAKYSRCKNLTVEVTDENDLLHLCITDDGLGFDTIEINENVASGNGLINMKKRADELKGKLIIDSKINEGTRVELVVKIWSQKTLIAIKTL